MSYKAMYGTAVGVAVIGAVLAAVQAAGPDRLGITATTLNWLGVINSGLIVLASVLPSVRKPPSETRVGLD